MKLIKPKFWDKKNLGFLSLTLLPFSFIYIVIANIYKFFQKEKKYSVPVICVGNIYIGGTGKTPICIKLKNLLDEKRVPIIIKKKYKNQKDEIELLKKYSKLKTKCTCTSIYFKFLKYYQKVGLVDLF